ncbi:uncharacterized protein A4U43_C03F22320 [Asparagus officinalis]|uniref:Uncharacterized protein n=1 Tax=Asparagus officinalis TaxID=4686 RepID=A0A5P1FC51_ASPOF|nr:uncharacterized protein A4U43_C03F22320 [Asparagus officinalis]
MSQREETYAIIRLLELPGWSLSSTFLVQPPPSAESSSPLHPSELVVPVHRHHSCPGSRPPPPHLDTSSFTKMTEFLLKLLDLLMGDEKLGRPLATRGEHTLDFLILYFHLLFQLVLTPPHHNEIAFLFCRLQIDDIPSSLLGLHLL